MVGTPTNIQSDWFRLETLDDSLQPTIDMLLNLAIFMWFGAVCPWWSFAHNNVIPIYRLIFLGILILLVRRLPIIFAMHKNIHQIENKFQASFVGFFGPIGVGAIFYLSVGREFLHKITVDDKVREDAQQVAEAIDVVVWFLVICSIVRYLFFFFRTGSHTNCVQVVHGLSIPLVKAGYHLPRTISSALSSATTAQDPEPIPIADIRHTHSTATPVMNPVQSRGKRRDNAREAPQPTAFHINRSVIRPKSPTSQAQPGTGNVEEPERPVNLVTHENESSATASTSIPTLRSD